MRFVPSVPGSTAGQLRRGWLAGLLLGAVSGFAVLTTGVVGIGVVVLSVALIAWQGPRVSAGAGFMTGLGGGWTAIFGRVLVVCNAENAKAGTQCVAPTIEAWIMAAATILAAGLVATLVVARRERAKA